MLFVGDVVGDAGLDLVCSRLPDLRREHELDVVVANGENSAADGGGLPVPALDRLLDAGVDVVTGGNHSWEHPQSLEHERVLRPLNVDPAYAGRGVLTLDLPERSLTVVNVADRDALRGTNGPPDDVTPILEAVEEVLADGDVVVDVHAEHVYTKQALAHALDGRVTAVLGTHSHEPTLALRRLPGGTALVTEVGMTGCPAGVMGFTPEAFIAGLRSGAVAAGDPALPTEGTAELAAVLLELDHGRVAQLTRLGPTTSGEQRWST